MNTNYAIRKIAEMIQTDKITVVKSDLSRNFTDKEMAEMTLGQLCNVYRLKDFIPVLGWDALSGSNEKDILIEVDRALMERLDSETEGGRTSDDFIRNVQTVITDGSEFIRKARVNMGIENFTIKNGVKQVEYERSFGRSVQRFDYSDPTGIFESFINLFVTRSANDCMTRNKPMSLEGFKWYHDLLMHGDSTTRINTLALKLGGISKLLRNAKNEFFYKAMYALCSGHNNVTMTQTSAETLDGVELVSMLGLGAEPEQMACSVGGSYDTPVVVADVDGTFGTTFKESIDRTLNNIPPKFRKEFFKLGEKIAVLHLSVQYMNKKPSTTKKQLLEDAYDLLEDVNFAIDDIREEAAKSPSSVQSSYDLAIQYFTTQSDRILFIIKEINDAANKKDNSIKTIKDAIPEEYRQYLAW